jgi:hypothetical protein
MQKTPFKNAAGDGVVQGIVVSKGAAQKLAVAVETGTSVTSCEALTACCRGCSRRGGAQNQALSIRSRWRCVCS